MPHFLTEFNNEYPDSTLTKADVAVLWRRQKGTCALTAIPIRIGKSTLLPHLVALRRPALVLDDPSGRAIPSNTMLVCRFVRQLMQSGMSAREFRSYVWDPISEARHDIIAHALALGADLKSDSPDIVFLRDVYVWIKHNYWRSSLKISLGETLKISAPHKMIGSFDLGKHAGGKSGSFTVMTSWEHEGEEDVLAVEGDAIKYTEAKKVSAAYASGDGPSIKMAPVEIFTDSLGDPRSLERTFEFLKERLAILTKTHKIGGICIGNSDG